MRLIIGTTLGELLDFDLNNLSCPNNQKKLTNKGILGIQFIDNMLYVSSNKEILVCDPIRFSVRHSYKNRHAEYHDLLVEKNRLLVANTANNSVEEFTRRLGRVRIHKIDPPSPNRPIIKKLNYNHINSICRNDDEYYVGLNWLTQKQYGPSGVCITDLEFNEKRRVEVGWEIHCPRIIGESLYLVCGSSAGIKTVRHPPEAGLMRVNGDFAGKLIYKHHPNIFCKNFTYSANKNNFYLMGSDSALRGNRGLSDGHIIVLNKNYDKIFYSRLKGHGGFTSCEIV